ncbi:MAG: hypothetical protein A3K15_04745 [Candidatus Edwardsbacteria bacterium GWE2_54_12]|nr:MAG: hypothetical protein A3K15_04745 [Candidatus Edwardsbacteria bacterium GWE2_54_12]
MIAEAAVKTGCRSVAFTYNDPVIFLEYAIDVAKACHQRGIKTVAVLDRSDSVGGFGGPVFTEVRSALYGSAHKPQIAGVVYGLGGREIDMEQIEKLFMDLKDGKFKADSVSYLGVRE